MFRERTRARADAVAHASPGAADLALAELLQSRPLRSHRLSRNCEIGPFVLDYVFSEASLVVELRSSADPPDRHSQTRAAFLGAMGYRVVRVRRHEIMAHPDRVVARIRAALQGRTRGYKQGTEHP